MATLEIINTKLDNLGGDMKIQTASLGAIEQHTKAIATVSMADQEARDRIYDRLADGLIKLARVISFGILLVLLLSVVSTFRQELHVSGMGGSLDVGQPVQGKQK